MATGHVTIECDGAPLIAYLDRLEAELPNLPAEVTERLRRLVESPSELCRFESQTTGGAIKIVVHPSEALLELAPALRAG